MPIILAIDDEPRILDVYRLVFSAPEFTVLTADTALGGVQLFKDQRADIVLLDVNLPDLSGMETYRRLREIDRRVPTIFLTGETTTGTAIEAMSLGAFEYLLKPIQIDKLLATVEEALRVRQLMEVPAQLPGQLVTDTRSDILIGHGAVMQNVCKTLGRLAAQDATVLILGESGTGKELVARALYQYSNRSAGPFLAVNCAAIPEALVESELFGHEKGAFTGADRRRVGKFEQCATGTLFLDEIGEMPLATQAKILRVLQEQSFERVGGNETIRSQVRVIAATNRNLEAMVDAGRFRGDLFYRLNVFSIWLPPLRDRLEDLPDLSLYFLRRFSNAMGREVVDIALETVEALQRHHWPGNIRELQSTIKQSLLKASGTVLLPEFLPEALGKQAPPPSVSTSEMDAFIDDRLRAGTPRLYDEWLAAGERGLFQRVLNHAKGNISEAARILGIHRNTLRTRLLALNIRLKPANEDDD